MGDDENAEPKYELFTAESLALGKSRENGSQQFTGAGTAKFLNGDVYNGSYIDGLRSGKGTYTFKKYGDTYEGQYQENKKNGFGKLIYRSGGGGEDDAEAEELPEGALPRGGNYLGYSSDGKRSGDGTFTYANGDTYVGQWQAGKKHGSGSYSYAKDGTKLIGEWDSGKILAGRWVFPNGVVYSGRFRYNKPFGEGAWVFPNGNQVTGEFVQKNQEEPGEPPAADEEPAGPQPDPKVWCHFKCGQSVAVQGGSIKDAA